MIGAAALLLLQAAAPTAERTVTAERDYTGIWLDEFEGQQFSKDWPTRAICVPSGPCR